MEYGHHQSWTAPETVTITAAGTYIWLRESHRKSQPKLSFFRLGIQD